MRFGRQSIVHFGFEFFFGTFQGWTAGHVVAGRGLAILFVPRPPPQTSSWCLIFVRGSITVDLTEHCNVENLGHFGGYSLPETTIKTQKPFNTGHTPDIDDLVLH